MTNETYQWEKKFGGKAYQEFVLKTSAGPLIATSETASYQRDYSLTLGEGKEAVVATIHFYSGEDSKESDLELSGDQERLKGLQGYKGEIKGSNLPRPIKNGLLALLNRLESQLEPIRTF